MGPASPRVLLVDNHDSFTWNLAQYLQELGATVLVRRNDEVRASEVVTEDWDALVISPGPGRPADAGAMPEIVSHCEGRLPLLGVCLGMQAIGESWGARLTGAPELVHGKASPIEHDGRGLFEGLPNPLRVGRYHSLVLDPASIRAPLRVTARTPEGVVMALEHQDEPTWGVQFHPESILTPDGKGLLRNFLRLAARGSGERPGGAHRPADRLVPAGGR